MDKYSDELEGLDKELNRYQRKIEKIRFLVAIKLIKRVRSGIPITDDKLFVGIPNMNHYLLRKWLNTDSLFSWAIFRSIKRYHYEINNIKLFVKFHEDKRLDKKF